MFKPLLIKAGISGNNQYVKKILRQNAIKKCLKRICEKMPLNAFYFLHIV